LSENLQNRELLGRDTFKRPADLSLRSNTLWEVQKTDIWKLITSVKKVLQLENYKQVPDIEIESEPIDQAKRKKEIIQNLRQFAKPNAAKEIVNNIVELI